MVPLSLPRAPLDSCVQLSKLCSVECFLPPRLGFQARHNTACQAIHAPIKYIFLLWQCTERARKGCATVASARNLQSAPTRKTGTSHLVSMRFHVRCQTMCSKIRLQQQCYSEIKGAWRCAGDASPYQGANMSRNEPAGFARTFTLNMFSIHHPQTRVNATTNAAITEMCTCSTRTACKLF